MLKLDSTKPAACILFFLQTHGGDALVAAGRIILILKKPAKTDDDDEHEHEHEDEKPDSDFENTS
jgi:hypothetical protein